MATSFLPRALLALPLVLIPLHLISMAFRIFRRSRLGGRRAIRSAAFLLFVPILLSAIFALPQPGRSPREAGAVSELAELKLKVSHLESILEKNIKELNSKVLLMEQKDRLIEEMNRKIQYLLDSLRNKKKSRGASAYSEERVNSLEEEIRNLWGEARKNNFDLHILQSKASDAEEKLDAMSSQALEMEDIITEQWIQIRQLEQALQVTKVRTSKAYKKMEPTGYTFLKFVNDLQQHLSEAICRLRSFFSKKNSMLSSYSSHAFKLLKRIISGVQRYHHELQGYVRQMMKKNEITEALTNQEFVNDLQQHLSEAICRLRSFFSKKNSMLSSYSSHAFKLLKRIISGVQRYHHELQGYVRQMMKKNEITEALTNQEVIFFLASAIITFPFMAAWLLYSSYSG